MIEIVTLQSALLDLLSELDGSNIKLLVGGGFGIYLKIQYVIKERLRTLLQEWPEERSTNDLDIFLRPELLIDKNALRPLKSALDKLEYIPVNRAKFWQFVKKYGEGEVKIDLLTGPEDCFEGTAAKVSSIRIKPRPSVELHARPVNEAPTLELGLLEVQLDFIQAVDTDTVRKVFIPHPYTFVMMKLFAFRDRKNDNKKDFGRHHALDIYSILATTTEEEWSQALKLSKDFSENSYVKEAGKLVRDLFADHDHLGIVRLKENKYYRSQMEIDKFISILADLFPS